mmetsp:Transcript_23321/g.54204  ORF Transcript_23321/g.54204 Transcript_23321/m.54204 type:complete len:232 (+) Transcript_23321:915-1610(+)
MKPSSVALPSASFFSAPRVSRMKGVLLSGSSMGVSFLTWSIDRMGVSITGPVPLMTSNSTPMEGRGVRMSENMMMPSVPNARKGCMDSSMAISGVSDLMRKGYLFEYALKSFMYLPACLISHTGVRSASSPFATLNRISCASALTLPLFSAAAGAPMRREEAAEETAAREAEVRGRRREEGEKAWAESPNTERAMRPAASVLDSILALRSKRLTASSSALLWRLIRSAVPK